MREEAEVERKTLKLKMDEEMRDLQAHLKLFQTVIVKPQSWKKFQTTSEI